MFYFIQNVTGYRQWDVAKSIEIWNMRGKLIIVDEDVYGRAIIGTVPAGNIILYSGSFPSKGLRMFHVLKCVES